MNKLFSCAVFLFIASCNPKSGLTEKDVAHIKLRILLHNNSFGLRHRLDSISFRSEVYQASLRMGAARARRYTDSVVNDRYEMEQQGLYTPVTDPNLTYEKLLLFCKERNADPVRVANTLSEK